MKAGDVQRIVHGVADAQAARAAAEKIAHDGTAQRMRIEALEALLDVVADVMLAGTTADPAAAKPKGKAKA